MFHQRKAMANTLSFENDGVVQVGFGRISGAACIQ